MKHPAEIKSNALRRTYLVMAIFPQVLLTICRVLIRAAGDFREDIVDDYHDFVDVWREPSE